MNCEQLVTHAREAKRSLTAAAGRIPSCVAIWRKSDRSWDAFFEPLRMSWWRDCRGWPIAVIILDSLAAVCLASPWRTLSFAKRDGRMEMRRTRGRHSRIG